MYVYYIHTRTYKYAMYIVPCTRYIVHSRATMYIVHVRCTMYDVRCTCVAAQIFLTVVSPLRPFCAFRASDDVERARKLASMPASNKPPQ